MAQPVPRSRRFAIGTFERNVTLFRQQMRALNLVYSLREADDQDLIISPDARLAVIGGGAFGLTAGAAAAAIGFEVRVYEKHEVLLPLQRGCDTRWVNPRYYEWPEPGSESRFAGLPLMDWRAGTASEVADQLESEYLEESELSGRIRTRLQVKGLSITEDASGTFVIDCAHGEGRDEWRCDAVILATGFGIEQDLGGQTTPYWRNDILAQPELEAGSATPQRYLVSGTGDGGLTDVARLKITNFRHERVFLELFDGLDRELLRQLRSLRRENAAGTSADWLYRSFEQLHSDASVGPAMRQIEERLRARLRTDTTVTVNGTSATFRDSLSLRSVSLSNALVGYLLHTLDAFTYKSGRLRYEKKWIITNGSNDEDIPKKVKVIVRHGTNREQPISELGWEDALPALAANASPAAPTAERIFPAGWWGVNRKRGGAASHAPSDAVEFVPPTTMMLATTFVSTLSDILVDKLNRRPRDGDARQVEKPLFRITLHRVIAINDQALFQQISPYRGELLERQIGGVGRIFTVEAGMVGLSVRTGRPVVFRREEQIGTFEKMKDVTSFEKLLAHPIEEHVDSMFVCPFFAADNDRRSSRVLFAIFADTSERGFFDSEVLRTVYAACKGFVTNIEDALQSRRLRPISDAAIGYEADMSLSAEDIESFREVGLSFDESEFADFRHGLTFTTLRSTHLDVGLARV